MENIAVKLTDVCMTFRLTTVRVDHIKDYFIKKIKKEIDYKEFEALKNINLEIKKGERIGIIGSNGAGKSTMLKIISKVFRPTSGELYTSGTIAPLLELGSGFDAELTGRKNIYLNGAILGKSEKFLDEHLDEIIEFSGLGDFIDVAVKNYSSGMKARLGFSVASLVDSDILILDEVLGVGDKEFKQKSSEKIQELIFSGKTVILVSHSLDQITKLTDKVIWLEKGEIKEIGDSKTVVENYKNS